MSLPSTGYLSRRMAELTNLLHKMGMSRSAWDVARSRKRKSNRNVPGAFGTSRVARGGAPRPLDRSEH